MDTSLTLDQLGKRLSELLTTYRKDEDCKHGEIRVIKRHRDLKDGDFVVPPGKLYQSIELDDQCESRLNESLVKYGLKLDSVGKTKHFPVSINLNRATTFKKVLSNVLEHGSEYGYVNSEDLTSKESTFVINPAGLITSLKDKVYNDNLPLSSLRTIVLLKHLVQLLKAHRLNARCIKHSFSAKTRKLIHLFNLDLLIGADKDTVSTSHIRDSVIKSRYRRHVRVERNGSNAGDTSETADDTVSIDIRQYLTDNPTIKGYDQNIQLVDVIKGGEPNEVLGRVISLEEAITELTKKPTSLTVLHITSHSRGYFQQQVDLLWRVTSGNSCVVNQKHLVHGPVHLKAELTPEDYYSKIREEIKESSEMKYGDKVQGDEWQKNIDAVTKATVMFEFLNCNSKNLLKLSVPSGSVDMTSVKRCGTFVMYNTARLAMLFKHYQEAVRKGQYPDLPPLDCIDFSLLKEEAEWILLFNFIWSFPDVVSSSIHKLSSETIQLDIHTHKVAVFLTSLSQQFSAYYSRVHVLGESRPHLYPMMFARLYLLKALYQVFTNALALLDIEPLTQL